MSKISLWLIAITVAVVIGLTILFHFESEPFRTTEYFGRFEGEPQVVLMDGGRNIRLLRAFKFTDVSKVDWIAPEGSIANGASIPPALWSIVGAPLEGLYRNASIIHDAYCPNEVQTWEATHLTFYYAMRASGVPPIKAKVMYYAVMAFGPRWSFSINDYGEKILSRDDPELTAENIHNVLEFRDRLENGDDLPLEKITPLAMAAGRFRGLGTVPAASEPSYRSSSSEGSGGGRKKPPKKNLRKKLKKRK